MLIDCLRPGTVADRVDGEVPPQVAEPDSPQAFADALKHASGERLPTVIRGGGTKLTWGRPPAAVDLVVSTTKLNRLIAHRHGDLTATVQAGMTLRDLNAALNAERQWLPIDHAFDEATIGGIVATNDAGPSRHRNGTPRDLVIGITLALTDGRLVKAGGTVVKNVAGYDLGKLVSGSHGTLAGIVDVTFKLVPVPQSSATLVVWYADSTRLARDAAALDASQIEPAAFDIRVEDGERPYQLKLRIATSPAARDAQIAAARALISGDGAVLTDVAERATWAAQLDTMSEGDATVRFGWLPARLPPVLTLLEEMRSVDGVGVTFTGRVLGAGVARLTGEVAALAAAIGRLRGSADVGNVVLLRGSHDLKERVDVWGPGQASDRVARAVKKTLDPMGILNAGRGPI
ncbi:MAG TPA: FAD-binding oxidoreductase [Vicinamibacterales bacterium]|nr:FAD-binding oxidoreductase [Vicinamibacterales bacterium]